MKKPVCLFILLVFVLFLCSCGMFGMDNLPKGELLASYPSPDEKYTVNIYLTDGGATTDYAVRGEAVEAETGKARNIYWQYHEDNADVVWISDDTVEINGIKLNVLTGKYDYRYDANQ
ncbi:MAG: DUF5412 domain-containing protein [Clostridia bacterium]|nr:DUF5412 domain-containing protein [Clostridia bacterium]